MHLVCTLLITASDAHKPVQILEGDSFCSNDTVAVAMRCAMKILENQEYG